MYWQKRLNRPNKDMKIENKIPKIRKENPNYGYRRITAMLKRLGLKIFSRKSRKYSSYKGQVWKIADNKIKRNFKVEKPYTQITTDTGRVCEKFCVSAPPYRLWADIFYFF